MNEIVYNNYDLVAFEQDGEVVVAVTFYRYYKKKAKGEVNYRWKTRCPELVDKIVRHRTKVFTGQLIQLAKAYGEKGSLNIKNRRKRYVKIRQGRYRNIYTRSYRY